jgi:Fic family protein
MAKSKLLGHTFPPNLGTIYDEEFANQLAATHGAVGSLKQIPRLLTNANLLMRPILSKEAESSSQLEGTQASAEDVFKLDVVDQTPEERREAEEVRNYEHAMRYGLERLKKYPLNNFLIRDMHKILMRGVRGARKNPGNFRTKDVWIGQKGTEKGSARYVPPDPTHVPPLMDELEKFISDYGTLHPLTAIGVIHHRFEAIHPFEDGNGRVGRLLVTLFLIKQGLLEMPILYPSGYFERHKRLYMSALSKVDRKEDWKSWLVFFLKGLEVQAGVSLNLSIKIDELFKRSRTKIEMESAGLNLIKVLETTFSHPYLTASILSRLTGIPRTTCIRYLAKLETKGIINEKGLGGQQKVYANDKLISILRKI